MSDNNQTSAWSSIKPAPYDPILGVNVEYNKDTNPNKVNLSIGAYKDEKGNPYTLKCVLKAVEKYAKAQVNHEYLPIGGSPEFIMHAIKLAYKSDFQFLNRIAAIQSLSGSGALRIAFRFLFEFYPFNGNQKGKIYFD